jgi:hypothetical protein
MEPTMIRPQERDSLSPPPAPPAVERIAYLVRPQRDIWIIEHDGDEYGPYESRHKAMFFAIDAAHKLGTQGKSTQVRLTDHYGQSLTTWTYGSDPYPPYL